jgi:hypothetical protein
LLETCRALTERLRDSPPSAETPQPPPKPVRPKRSARLSGG